MIHDKILARLVSAISQLDKATVEIRDNQTLENSFISSGIDDIREDLWDLTKVVTIHKKHTAEQYTMALVKGEDHEH